MKGLCWYGSMGGGYTTGGTNVPIYNGEALVKKHGRR